ncbi:hypothetical protein CJF42_19390 [Pseudoalteromonas sp. NBT06-2]|uniref:hypothetical protein n=1 Tax=Pseudoalteromonas sp. NBT06-2 TaxID=2025950 RepID=UPI000BA5FFFD|nr:hypothetical protein [Pseudoalteromonas sp. NBT06-2]PAJ72769.1 hypothetical protein CJF42_19390 [Pseudoalteromonas sp. NBT06-2]
MLSEVEVMFNDILIDILNDESKSSHICIKTLARYARLNEQDIKSWINPDIEVAPRKSQVLAVYRVLNGNMNSSITDEQRLNFEELQIQAKMIEQAISIESSVAI